uniref:Putative secreted protein n=1 Tax=Anopheles triannulatus TaxID=58253 RepID=A0A2M4B2V9_9DIPT
MGAARTIITFTFLFSCSPSWSLIWIASEQADRSGNRSVVRLGNDSLHFARSRTEIHSQGRWGCGCETHTRVSVECELLQNINWEKKAFACTQHWRSITFKSKKTTTTNQTQILQSMQYHRQQARWMVSVQQHQVYCDAAATAAARRRRCCSAPHVLCTDFAGFDHKHKCNAQQRASNITRDQCTVYASTAHTIGCCGCC